MYRLRAAALDQFYKGSKVETRSFGVALGLSGGVGNGSGAGLIMSGVRLVHLPLWPIDGELRNSGGSFQKGERVIWLEGTARDADSGLPTFLDLSLPIPAAATVDVGVLSTPILLCYAGFVEDCHQCVGVRGSLFDRFTRAWCHAKRSEIERCIVRSRASLANPGDCDLRHGQRLVPGHYGDRVTATLPTTSSARRSERSVIGFVAFMAIVMAYGVEAILPAFDEIDRSFGFSRQSVSVSLLVTTLLAGMGVGQLIWGPVSDTFGRIPVLLVGLSLYALGAVGMVFAPSLELLLLSRFVWGIGAAAPNGLRLAAARDVFSGDQMARVVTFATAVFLIGPVLMPFIGEGILLLGDWELIALVGVGLAVAAAGVAIWFGETLPVERRRPLRFKPLMVALRQIVRTPASAGAILAAMFYGGAFFIFLGSAQPIIENIYNSGDQFVWLFGLSGVAMSIALFSNGRLITRFGAARVASVAAVCFVAVNVVGLITTLATNGTPSLAVWLIWVCASNAAGSMVAAICGALALEPMGAIAGTAASILAFAQLGPGAALAAIVDAQISETVTPMLIGALAYSLLGIGCLRWSLRERSS